MRIVTNKKTGVKSNLTEKQFKKITSDPNWNKKFEYEIDPPTPPEVKESKNKNIKSEKE